MAKDNQTLEISALKQGRVKIRVLSQTGMFYNAMSAKTKRTLLLGGGKKTAAEKKNLKHDPEQEFRDSVYTQTFGDALLCFPAPGFKNAMATAALVTDGVKKTDVQRLIFLPHEKVSIYGLPFLRMDVVRSADMNRTPDIRTRAYLPRWCAEIDVAYVTPNLSAANIANLLANAGQVCGIGDFRQEKGKGSYGTFSVIGDDDVEAQKLFDHLKDKEGRAAQELAMANPKTIDSETEELWEILREERIRRAA